MNFTLSLPFFKSAFPQCHHRSRLHRVSVPEAGPGALVRELVILSHPGALTHVIVVLDASQQSKRHLHAPSLRGHLEESRRPLQSCMCLGGVAHTSCHLLWMEKGEGDKVHSDPIYCSCGRSKPATGAPQELQESGYVYDMCIQNCCGL